MKYTKNLLAALALLFVPLSMTVAQDDVYFVGKKTKKAANNSLHSSGNHLRRR